VSDAAKEKGKLSIGNLVSTQAQFPETVMTSCLWHMDPTMNTVIAQLKNGKFVATDYSESMTLKNGGASLAPFGTFENKIPADLKQRVRQREAEIKDGRFVVEINAKEPKSNKA
jgi:basic membrane lipoprotein Med (substrate-binding protein (PBP1-ABC) superfamily)